MIWKRRDKVIEENLVDYLEKIFNEKINDGYKLKVCVGTDSQRSGKGFKFATAIVITTQSDDGSGKGAIVIGSTFMEKNKMSIKERMLKEVYKSIDVSYNIYELLDLYGVELEVHADINTNPLYDSNSALKEAIGYIQGMGYGFKVKPNAFAASSGADRMC